MAKTLQTSLAVVLMSSAVALAAPAYAAASKSTNQAASSTNVDLQHTSTKAAGLKGKKLATVDANERKITAELNKQAMAGATGQQSFNAQPDSGNQQQAAVDSESDTITQ